MLDLKGIRERLGRATPGEYELLMGQAKQDITSLLSEVDSLRETLRVAEEALNEIHQFNPTLKSLSDAKSIERIAKEALSKIKTQLEGEG